MIDKAKRKTLKNISAIAATGVAVASTASTGSVLAGSDAAQLSNDTQGLVAQPQVRVHSRVSAQRNDIEVVLTNTSDYPLTITEMTPSETVTRRGRFVFSAITSDGDVYLPAGHSVSVPMTPHPVVLDGSPASNRSVSLIAALKKSMTVTTAGDIAAEVTVMDATLFV